MTSIALFAKAPVPGTVKTRLVPPLTHDDAARVARACLEDTILHLAAAIPARWTLFLEGHADEPLRAMARSRGMEILPQRGSNLGERLASGFRALWEGGARRVLAVGSDSPTLNPERIQEAIAALAQTDLVLGPTEDGGYYLIGMSSLHPEVFEGIPWSTGSTTSATLERARALGLAARILAPWYDLDDVDALLRAREDLRPGCALEGVLDAIFGRLTGAVSEPT